MTGQSIQCIGLITSDADNVASPTRATRKESSHPERLVESAANLLWERNYGSAGVDDLCRAANARKGSFYHFFPTKADLAIAAIEFQWETAQREVLVVGESVVG